jgi:hypothetical protein
MTLAQNRNRWRSLIFHKNITVKRSIFNEPWFDSFRDAVFNYVCWIFFITEKKNGYGVNLPLPVNNVTLNIFTIYYKKNNKKNNEELKIDTCCDFVLKSYHFSVHWTVMLVIWRPANWLLSSIWTVVDLSEWFVYHFESPALFWW